jgi:CHAT domain-containing protein
LGVIATRKEVLVEQNPEYLRSLNNLASVYSALGNYRDALEITQKVVELSKVALGVNHPDYLHYLSNLGSAYNDLGNYQKALEINLMTSELRKEILGEKHPDYLTSLNNIAMVYSELGNYQDDLEIRLKVAELSKEILGAKHPVYLLYLSNLGMAYLDLGNYQKALEINLMTSELRKEILGEKHPDYLTSLNNLAVVYSAMGNYQQALEINMKVAEIRKDVLGEKHPDYLMSLNNLASVYSAMGNYQQSLEINIKVAETEKDVLGEKHPDYLTSLSNLATVYGDLGNYQQALEVNLKVAEIRKEILGVSHPDYLMSLNNIAADYCDLGNYQKALEVNLKVAEIRKDVLGDKHPDYLQSLNNLALDYSDLGNYQKALEINLKVAEIRKDVLGEKHPDYLTSLNNLATVYDDLGNYQKAFEIDQKVTVSFKEVLGKNHPDYLISLNNLAFDEFRLSQIDSALCHKRIVTQGIQRKIVENFSFLTENQRELFFKRYRLLLMYSTLFVESSHLNNPESVGYVLDLALFSKGLLLNTTLDFDKLIAEKGTPEAITKFEDLKLIKLQFQRLNEKPITERYLSVDSLENIAQQKETELVKISKEYGDYTSNLKVTWKDIQANLQDKDVAIEFVEYPTLTDTVKYAALVLRKGWQYPKFIPLFRKDEIEGFIRLDKNRIYSNDDIIGKQLRNLIWTPLETVVSPGDRVYFSPAGIIHLLAIENLPVDDSTTLGDRYQMYRLSSTKELALNEPESQNNTAVLYGGLKYDLDVKEMANESKKYEKREKLYAMRGYSNDSAVRKGCEYLSGTLQEVNQISRLMSEKQYYVSTYTGATGNEESFKSLSGTRPGIIHIATHGFFLPIEESRNNLFMQMRMGDQQETGGGIDPMLRSGLIMAGGNRAWQGGTVSDSIEDSVLTAREISRMDLRGTDLVVLSACETGLGDVSSEGVFGLQRSFKQAGVHTLVMSLWEVNDDATKYFMTEFYSNLLSGKDKRTAFLEAKRKCKEKYTYPQYWAAFIMLD